MNRRRKNNISYSPIWTWISFIVFVIVLTFLGYSIIKKQSPTKTLRSLVTPKTPKDSISSMSKAALISLIKKQQSEIKDLQDELLTYTADDGFEIGIISTTSDALNLRSEPSLDSDILFKIPNGSEISIIYYDSEELILEGAPGKWCKVKYADMEGWVWGNYIQKL